MGAGPRSSRVCSSGDPVHSEAPIEGMRYTSGGLSGVTDASGSFRYEQGQPITFSLGGIVFGPVDGAATLTSFQLVGKHLCEVSEGLIRLLVLLEALDSDGNPDSGITLALPPSSGALRPFDSLTDGDLPGLVQELRPGATIPDGPMTLERFIRRVDDEAWETIGTETWGIFSGVPRSQGAAWDGKRWFFSARQSMQRADTAFDVEVQVFGIPKAIEDLGGNHIGDLDVYNGTLYTAIEDGPAYKHPFVALFDAETLAFTGRSYMLDPAMHTLGVPWVSVDGPRKRVYTAEWDPTERLNIHDLEHELKFVGNLPLKMKLGRIQGAKVFHGALYAAADDERKTVYKINLETGTVIKLLELGTPGSEMEGIALSADGTNALMHTLNIVAPNVLFVHHKRVRGPVRELACPAM